MAIASLASLTSLDLTGCWRLTDAALAVPLSRIPLLTSLGLSGLPWLSTAAASAASRLPHLRRLDLSGCNGLSDGDVALLSAGSLRELCLSGCQRLTAEGLRPLRAIGCSIQRLDLGRSLHLPASGAKYLDRLGALTYLSLEAWIKVTLLPPTPPTTVPLSPTWRRLFACSLRFAPQPLPSQTPPSPPSPSSHILPTPSFRRSCMLISIEHTAE